MINRKIVLDVLSETQCLSKCGLLLPNERTEISEACKSYTQNGDDDMFYEFLEYCSMNMSQEVARKKFEKLKEDIYNDNSQNSGSQNDNRGS